MRPPVTGLMPRTPLLGLGASNCKLPHHHIDKHTARRIEPQADYRVRVLCPEVDVEAAAQMSKAEALTALKLGDEDVGFLQFFHLRRESSAIADIVRGARLSNIACGLLGCSRVRVYQVCSPLHLRPPAAQAPHALSLRVAQMHLACCGWLHPDRKCT